jgi:hypothetical protein
VTEARLFSNCCLEASNAVRRLPTGGTTNRHRDPRPGSAPAMSEQGARMALSAPTEAITTRRSGWGLRPNPIDYRQARQEFSREAPSSWLSGLPGDGPNIACEAVDRLRSALRDRHRPDRLPHPDDRHPRAARFRRSRGGLWPCPPLWMDSSCSLQVTARRTASSSARPAVI